MPQQSMQVDFTQVVNELANRLRILEGKQSLLSEKLLVMNQNVLEEYKKLLDKIKSLESTMQDDKVDVGKVKNIVKHLSEEASKFAQQNDVKVLEKYIKLWDPMNFVTEKDVQRIVQESLPKKRKRIKKKKRKKKKKRHHA